MRGCGGEGGRETIPRTRPLRSFLSSSDIGILFRRLGLRHRSEVRIHRHSVEKRQQFPHCRDYSPLVRMPLRALLAVVGAKDGIPHDASHRRHVERIPYIPAPAPYPALPLLRSALPLLGSDADKLSQPAACQGHA